MRQQSQHHGKTFRLRDAAALDRENGRIDKEYQTKGFGYGFLDQKTWR
jgi:hypothetical protein